MSAVARPKVVIVGGGFGGLSCAKALDGKPVDVVLVDSSNYHLFTPLLYQVATALLTAPDIARPFRAIFRGSKNVRFQQARVSGFDPVGRRVRTESGQEVAYDYLVLATGSTNNYFGNERLQAATSGMKTLRDALALRNRALACLERAAQAVSDEERRRWLTFLVVGGGPTGTEYAGALKELLRLVLGRDYPELRPDLARIVIAEGHDRLLSAFSEKLGRYAESVLEKRGIEIMTGVLVTDAGDGCARLSTGITIETHTVVWSAGVRPNPLAAMPDAEQSASARITVDERLRLPALDGVFAIGDLASVDVDGSELPMLSAPAMQEGRYVARAILAAAAGSDGSSEPFRYRDKGTMATVGRNAAVAELGRVRLTGFLAWVLWLFVHLYYLIGFRNRTAVFLSWGWNYVREDRPIRIITRTEPDNVADALLDDLGERDPEAPGPH